jgi:hypothetical protein
MTPGCYDLKLNQGATFVLSFVVDEESFSFDDYNEFRMQIRESTDSDKVVWDSNHHYGSLVKTSSSILALTIDAETTAGFEFDNAGYDIELIKYTSPVVIHKFLTGKVLLNKEYTKPDVS